MFGLSWLTLAFAGDKLKKLWKSPTTRIVAAIGAGVLLLVIVHHLGWRKGHAESEKVIADYKKSVEQLSKAKKQATDNVAVLLGKLNQVKQDNLTLAQQKNEEIVKFVQVAVPGATRTVYVPSAQPGEAPRAIQEPLLTIGAVHVYNAAVNGVAADAFKSLNGDSSGLGLSDLLRTDVNDNLVTGNRCIADLETWKTWYNQVYTVWKQAEDTKNVKLK